MAGVAQRSVGEQPANVLAALRAGIVVHHQGGHMVELEVDREAENHGLQQRRDDEHEHDAPVAHGLADLFAHDRAQLHRPARLHHHASLRLKRAVASAMMARAKMVSATRSVHRIDRPLPLSMIPRMACTK